jgi:hypothetical protein
MLNEFNLFKFGRVTGSSVGTHRAKLTALLCGNVNIAKKGARHADGRPYAEYANQDDGIRADFCESGIEKPMCLRSW